MTLVLSRKATNGVGSLAKWFSRSSLNRLSQRSKAPRLRRNGPQWARVALLVVVADCLLATATWIAVDFFLH
jgi:hypothetical protein